MLDHPRKTPQLLSALRAAVPFEVELAQPVAESLRSEKVAAAERSRHVVNRVDYAGDEGGIMCFIARHDKQGALVISLTYVRVPSSMPLATAVTAYQKHRVKKLKKQNRES